MCTNLCAEPSVTTMSAARMNMHMHLYKMANYIIRCNAGSRLSRSLYLYQAHIHMHLQFVQSCGGLAPDTVCEYRIMRHCITTLSIDAHVYKSTTHESKNLVSRCTEPVMLSLHSIEYIARTFRCGHGRPCRAAAGLEAFSACSA